MFYDRFKLFCDIKGISITRATEEIGLARTIGTKWKKTAAMPNGETLSRIAAYFGITVSELMGEETEKGPSLSVEPNKDYLLAALDNMSRDELLEHLELVTKKLRERDKR